MVSQDSQTAFVLVLLAEKQPSTIHDGRQCGLQLAGNKSAMASIDRLCSAPAMVFVMVVHTDVRRLQVLCEHLKGAPIHDRVMCAQCKHILLLPLHIKDHHQSSTASDHSEAMFDIAWDCP